MGAALQLFRMMKILAWRPPARWPCKRIDCQCDTLPATNIELAAWLRLSLAPGLKPAALRLLLAAFGLPEAIFNQSPEALAEIAGEAAARAVLAPPIPDFDAQLDAVIAWRELPGNHVVTLDDPAYPPALLTMPDPPPLLYIKGRLDLLHTRAVALVGSRSATHKALKTRSASRVSFRRPASRSCRGSRWASTVPRIGAAWKASVVRWP